MLSASSIFRQPVVNTPPFPTPILENLLNNRRVDRKRMDMRGVEFNIHVSDLIKISTQDRFCPRELVLSHFEARESVVRGLTPGLELLYALGNAIHDLARNKFIAGRYGAYAWGNWRCPCSNLKLHGCVRPDITIPANVCLVCKRPARIYFEYSLFLKKYRLVGHPDFIIKWGDIYHLVEIKTIDRVGINFDDLSAPMGDHVLQASFYYWMMRDLGFNVASKIIYLYVDRSSSKLWRGWPYKEMEAMRAAPERIKPFLLRAEEVINGISTATLPKKISVCTSDICSRAKNCAVSVSCFSRTTNRIAHTGLAGASTPSGIRPVSQLHGVSVVGPDNRPLGTPQVPLGRKTRVDPQQFDIGGRRVLRREPATPERNVSMPGRIQFRQPPTTRRP